MDPRPRFDPATRSGAHHVVLLAAGVAVLVGVAGVGVAVQWLSGTGITFSLPALVWMAMPALLALAFLGWVVWRVYDEREEPDALQPADLVGLLVAPTAAAALQGAVRWRWPHAPGVVHHAVGGAAFALTGLVVWRMALRARAARAKRSPAA